MAVRGLTTWVLLAALLMPWGRALAQDTVTVTASVPTTYEQSSQPAIFTVQRDGTVGSLAVILAFSGTAKDTVTNGSDYTMTLAGVPVSGATVAVTIPAGSTNADVLISAVNDGEVERAEKVIATLAVSPSYTVGSPNSAEIQIGDDDIQLTLVTVDATARETPTDGQFVDHARFDLKWSTIQGPYIGDGFPVQLEVRNTTTATMGTDCFLAFRPNTFSNHVQATSWNPILHEITLANPPGNLGNGMSIWLQNDSLPRQIQATATGAAVWKLSSDPDGVVIGGLSGGVDVFFALPGAFDILSTNLPDSASSLQLWFIPLQDALPEGEEIAELTVRSSTNFLLPNPTTTMIRIADDDVRIGIRQVSHTQEWTPDQPGTAVIEIQGGIQAPKDLTVRFSIPFAAGSASSSGTNKDFQLDSGISFSDTNLIGSITLPKGASSATMSVFTVLDADNSEGTETVTISLLDGNDYVLLPNSGSVSNTSATINILDCQGIVSIASPGTTAAAEYPTTSVIFTVNVDRTVATEAVAVPFSWSGSASMADVAFTPSTGSATSGTVTIPAGQTTATITVTPVDDQLYESSESLVIAITTPSTYGYCLKTGGPTTAAMTISDDEPTIGIAAIASVSEGQTANALVVSLLGPGPATPAATLPYAVTVAYTVDGTATAGSDYTALTGSAIIPSGQTSATVAITALTDADYEMTAETVLVTLSATSAYALAADTALRSATVTIIDTTPHVVLSATPAAVKEGDPAATITATLTNPPASLSASQPFVVAYATSGSATTADVVLSATILSFTTINPDGSATTAITVSAPADGLAEIPETFVCTASPSTTCAVVAGQDSVTITLTDNTPQVTIARVQDAVEGGQPGLLIITNTANQPSSNLQVAFTVSGTASSSDYASFASSVSIPPGGSATVSITAYEDGIMEIQETVIVTLADSATGSYAVASPAATVTITEQVAQVGLRWKQDAVEGAQNGIVEAYLLPEGSVMGRSITANFAIDGDAKDGTDYTLSTTAFTIPAGSTSSTITLVATEDNTVEKAEKATFTLANATDGSYLVAASAASATLYIADYLPQIAITATQPATVEGGQPGLLVISYAPRPALPTAIPVGYALSGTATYGLDYRLSTDDGSGTLTIPANTNSITLTLVATDDVLLEGTETAVMTAVASKTGAYQIVASQASATVTITDKGTNKPAAAVFPGGGGSSGGCGLGSGLGALVGLAAALAAVLRWRPRRR